MTNEMHHDTPVWWMSRVYVPDRLRGRGVGSKIVGTLIGHVKTLDKRIGRIVVAPGGYGSDPVRLVNFYEKLGFKMIKEGLYAIDTYKFKEKEHGKDR